MLQVDGAQGLLSVQGGSHISGGATVNLNQGQLNLFSNARVSSSTINIARGAQLDMSSATVSGGIINNNGTAIVLNQTVLSGGSLNNQIDGSLTVNNGRSMALQSGNFTNDGTITLAGSSSLTTLLIGGNVTLDGIGSLQLTDSLHSRITGEFTSARIVNGQGHTILGSGAIGLNQLLLTNRGTVKVEKPGETMTIDLNGLTEQNVNAGNISASGGGRIIFNGTAIVNHELGDPGLIAANNGSVVIDVGSIIRGGNFQVNGSNGSLTVQGTSAVEGAIVEVNEGKLNVFANGTMTESTINIGAAGALELSTARFDGSTLNNSGVVSGLNSSDLGTTDLNIELGGLLTLNNGETLRVADSSHQNNGTIVIDGNTSPTTLLIDGIVSLGGSGRLQLTDENNSRITASDDGIWLVNQVGHTISGSGMIGLNQMRLSNLGLIEASQAADVLTIDTSVETVNQGVIRGRNGGKIVVNNSEFDNQGVVEVLNGSEISFNGRTEIQNIDGSGTLSNGIWRVIDEGAGATLNINSSNSFTGIGAAATVTISGPNALLRVNGGSAGDSQINGGELNVLNGGTLFIGQNLTNRGTVTVSGAVSQISSNGYTQIEGRTILDGGTLSVLDSIDFLGGRLEGSGTVVGDVNFSGLGTTIAPGLAAGGGALALTEVPEPATMMPLIAICTMYLLR